MQGLFAFSGSWHDPLPALGRSGLILLMVVGLESLAFLLRDQLPALSPVFILGMLRALDVFVLLAFGPWSLQIRPARILRETLVLAVCLVAAGFLVLAAWKVIFGYPLLGAGPIATFPSRPALWTYYATACVLSPVAEELVFRGILYRRVREGLSVVFSVGVVSVIFASLHIPFSGQFMVPFLGSIIFCLAYEKTKSIITPILLHMIGNTTIYLMPLTGLT